MVVVWLQQNQPVTSVKIISGLIVRDHIVMFIVDKGGAMKNIILILVFGILMIGCKKNKEEPDPTVLEITVKKSNGDIAAYAHVVVDRCTNSDVAVSGCYYVGSQNGYADANGKYIITNAQTDVYYSISADDSGSGEIELNHVVGKLPAHKTTYTTVNMHP